MNQLQIFENEQFGKVRAVMINNESWLVGKDVVEALGYVVNKTTSYTKYINKFCDIEDVKKMNNSEAELFGMTDAGRKGEMLINESGLFSLVLDSPLPQAKQFRRWVTSEVLPTIRKTGGYISNSDLMVNTYFGNCDETSKQLVKGLLDNIEKQQKQIVSLETEVAHKENTIIGLTNEIEIKDQVIKDYTPKVSYYDLVLQSKGTVTITQIAKDYGMSGRQFNAKLHEMKIQYKQSNTWLLYSKYQGMGYTQSSTYVDDTGVSRLNTKWTSKGRLFIYDEMKKNGILPLIEKNN